MNELKLEATPSFELTLGEEEVKVTPEIPKEEPLSEEEERLIKEFSEKIDLQNSTIVMQYGSSAQKKIASFSDSALENVRTKDLGEVGNELTDLITELKCFDVEEEESGGFLGFFKKKSNKLAAIKNKYDSAETNVNRICESLENHQVQLMKDIVLLDKLYEMNLEYYKELSMYILAGKIKLEKERTKTLPVLLQRAKISGSPADAQNARDFTERCDNFEKKLHDLELTKMVCIQMSPQIRLVQNNDRIMAEKIQSTIVNTIPLWKSQMVLSMGISHSNDAMQAQREVTNMTNELLKRNAETLKTSTIETAKETERGIVDIETLKHTNQSLISTLDEVFKIQEDGKQKRRAAEQELVKLEAELKEKLLNAKS